MVVMDACSRIVHGAREYGAGRDETGWQAQRGRLIMLAGIAWSAFETHTTRRSCTKQALFLGAHGRLGYRAQHSCHFLGDVVEVARPPVVQNASLTLTHSAEREVVSRGQVDVQRGLSEGLAETSESHHSRSLVVAGIKKQTTQTSNTTTASGSGARRQAGSAAAEDATRRSQLDRNQSSAEQVHVRCHRSESARLRLQRNDGATDVCLVGAPKRRHSSSYSRRGQKPKHRE